MRSVFTSLALGLIAIAGCSGMQVGSDVDPEASFEGLRTYSWIVTEDSQGRGALQTNLMARQRIMRASERELAAKGFEKVTDNPDFLLAFYAVSTKQVEVADVCGAWTGYGLYCGFHTSRPTPIDYDQGTLVLAVADADEKKVWWMGWAQDVVDPTRPDKSEEQINKAVSMILADFPPAQ